MDPSVPQSDNWATNVGWSYGFVLDPPPASVVSGGHCVCVTGFVADEAKPLGGYFILRNSWSAQWGSLLAAAGYLAPEAGYGQISASYVDQYLWELGRL
jgi:C1A family cysteine protease